MGSWPAQRNCGVPIATLDAIKRMYKLVALIGLTPQDAGGWKGPGLRTPFRCEAAGGQGPLLASPCRARWRLQNGADR